MGKGLGTLGHKGFSFKPLNKGIGNSRSKGLYPTKTDGAGLYGTAQFPTILENYNRVSDYKRWQLGQAYYFGTGRSWDDLSFYSNSRFVTGAVSGVSKDIVTMFPSADSPEGAWYVGQRTRGSIILPQPISATAITTNTSDPDPANHTLTYDVSGILNPAQIGIFNIFIGEQFEDTASGPNYPDDVVEKPEGSVALTLVAANSGSMTLVFDLSKAYGRVKFNNTIYWKKLDYSPSSPNIWDTSNGRHLCSSTKMFCCCPDHLGGALANLEFPKGEVDQDMFPLPNAQRNVRSAWESQGAGYYRQWRSLPRRIDERRECKHMHAMRWECGIPWYEPSDVPTQYFGSETRGLLTDASIEQPYGDNVYDAYNSKHRINYDRYALALAEVVGIELFPGSDVRDGIRSDQRPMLWNDADEPLASWCRQNDWWCRRGTQEIRIFNSTTQQFEATVNIGGVDYPMIEIVKAGSNGAPIIVP